MHNSIPIEKFQLSWEIINNFCTLLPNWPLIFHMQQLWQELAEELLHETISQSLDLGKKIHKLFMMTNGFILDIFADSSLIDMYSKCGQIENA